MAGLAEGVWRLEKYASVIYEVARPRNLGQNIEISDG